MLDEAAFPRELVLVYHGLERHGNHWAMLEQDRLVWASGLDVLVLAKEKEIDVLLWVSYPTTHDANLQHSARGKALARQ